MTYIVGAPGAQVVPVVVRPARVTPPALLTSLVVSSPGGAVDLMARPCKVQKARGLTAVTTRPDLVDVPGRDGSVMRRLTRASNPADAREVELQLFIGHDPSVDTPALLSAFVDQLQDVLDPEVWEGQSGDLLLTGYRADGTTRHVKVVHAPIAGEWDPPAWWQTVWMPTLRLVAPDPWFRSVAAPITWAASTGAPPMLPFFPLRVGSSTVVGNSNPVRVRGDRDALPTITVSGPAVSITAERGDGVSWTLVPPAPLIAEQTVTVRHDPDTGVTDDFDTVTGPAGEPWYRYLAAGSRLWGLRPGLEQVKVTVQGIEDDTTASIAWDHRYRSLL